METNYLNNSYINDSFLYHMARQQTGIIYMDFDLLRRWQLENQLFQI